MSESNIDDITLAKSVIEMATVANEFCYFFDTIEKKDKQVILDFYTAYIAFTISQRYFIAQYKPGVS